MIAQSVWQAEEAHDRVEDIIDAAVTDGPQIIRRRGEDVVVVVSIEDWERRRPSLKDWLFNPKGRTDDLLAGDSRDIEVSGLDRED